jgi:glycosyltransferase involved in cell wall biosynthesis
VHGHDVTSYAWREEDYYRRQLLAADVVVVPSQFLVEPVCALGVPRERVMAIPAGVDVRWFVPKPLPTGPPEVLFVGRFVEKKGLDVLLEAWPEVRTRVPVARLRVLGHGPLESMARSAGPEVTVELTDESRRATQVRDALRDAFVVVTPSRTASDQDAESLLLVNLEAQASGRPVVTTKHGGIPEFVSDGTTAVLVPENDPAALADALVQVLSDEEMARRMGGAGPEWVRRFDVRECTARVDDLYDTLLT